MRSQMGPGTLETGGATLSRNSLNKYRITVWTLVDQLFVPSTCCIQNIIKSFLMVIFLEIGDYFMQVALRLNLFFSFTQFKNDCSHCLSRATSLHPGLLQSCFPPQLRYFENLNSEQLKHYVPPLILLLFSVSHLNMRALDLNTKMPFILKTVIIY